MPRTDSYLWYLVISVEARNSDSGKKARRFPPMRDNALDSYAHGLKQALKEFDYQQGSSDGTRQKRGGDDNITELIGRLLGLLEGP
jgi:hypothetical protein